MQSWTQLLGRRQQPPCAQTTRRPLPLLLQLLRREQLALHSWRFDGRVEQSDAQPWVVGKGRLSAQRTCPGYSAHARRASNGNGQTESLQQAAAACVVARMHTVMHVHSRSSGSAPVPSATMLERAAASAGCAAEQNERAAASKKVQRSRFVRGLQREQRMQKRRNKRAINEISC